MIPMDPQTSLQITRMIPGPREKVFDAFVVPELRKKWWSASAGQRCTLCEIDARKGGKYRINMISADHEFVTVGQFVEFDRPQKLVFTWSWEKPTEEIKESLVTIQLKAPNDSTTELTLTHERLKSPEFRDMHAHGWAGCLGALANLMQYGTAAPNKTPGNVKDHKVVPAEDWLKTRKELLAKEKEFTRLRDELTQIRRDMPWEKVEKNYVFDGPRGKESLADLFDGKSQLIVYHFMFDPGWPEGCKSCSYWIDNINGIAIHLKHRDAMSVAIAHAPFETIEPFRKRMGWGIKFVSAFNMDFNYDYHVSFTPEEMKQEKVFYNFGMSKRFSSEGPGISVFYKDEKGNIFHTYSTFGRGLDMLNVAYHYMDLLPKGRDEAGLKGTQAWVRHHDKY